MADKLLKVKIMTPQAVLFAGPAQAVSSANSQGKFDILPEHANFISIVAGHPITILKQDQQKVEFNFDQAIIHCSQNQVSIYANPISK